MQHTVVVQDQSFTGHQRMLDLKAWIVREMAEKIERRDRLAGKRCTGDLGGVLAHSARAVDQDRNDIPAAPRARRCFIGHKECEPFLQHRQQICIFFPNCLANAVGADQTVGAAVACRPLAKENDHRRRVGVRIQFAGRAVTAVVEFVLVGKIYDLDQHFLLGVLRQQPAQGLAEACEAIAGVSRMRHHIPHQRESRAIAQLGPNPRKIICRVARKA